MIYTFYVPGMPFDGTTIPRGESLGGSESAGYYLAREMARRGHRVYVFTNIPPERQGEADGVHYLSLGRIAPESPHGDMFQHYVARVPHDVLVAQRVPGVLSHARANKIGLWWIHDIAIKRHLPGIGAQLWNTDGILAPSHWHIEQAAGVYGIDKAWFHVVRNAIDPGLFGEPPDIARKLRGKTLLYTSRPERGLEHLAKKGGIMERLLQADPEIRLLICGYSHAPPDMQAYYDRLVQRCQHLPNVEIAGHLSKQVLAETMRGAWLHVYPTEFEEVSCISAMESQAAGTPILTRQVAALPETLRNGGVEWVKGEGVDAERFAQQILRLRDHPEQWHAMHRRALKRAKVFTWEESGKTLEDISQGLLRRRQNSPARMARHLMVHGEIMGLRDYVEERPAEEKTDPILRETAIELGAHYGFVFDGDYAGHYAAFYESEKVKGVHYGPTEAAGDPRYEETAKALSALPPGTRVLDWGCAHGPQTVNLARQFPQFRFLGVDLVPSNVEIARNWVAEWKLENVEVTDVEGFHALMAADAGVSGGFDVIMLQEVLEHTPDAGAQVDALVPYCEEGGRFICSTPTGPVEYISRVQSDHDFQWRGHIQHLEPADVLTLFGHHPGFAMQHIHWQSWRDLPVGWHLFAFGRPEAPSGKLDRLARIAVQAPRETVTACLLCRPDSPTLAKTLGVLHRRVDQIVIGIDMGEKALGAREGRAWEIAAEYGAETFGIVSPLVQGFDAARNETIARAVGDWILWIDDDEELVWPERMHKYLRPNAYDAYAVPQKHFSLEPEGLIKTDLPTRLFRNRKGIRFFGVVHEHPETELNKGPGQVLVLPDVVIAHNGYLTEAGRRARFQRNFPLMERDREKYPERRLGQFLWLRDLAHLNRFELERTRAASDAMVKRAEEALVLWRAFVKDGEARFATDGLPYYSEMARFLGNGNCIEAQFVMGLRRDNLGGKTHNPMADTRNPDDPMVTGWFATPEDLKRYISVIQDDLVKIVNEPRYF